MHPSTHILTRAGRHSLAVVIPKEFLKKLRWKARQRLTVTLREKTVEVRDWKPTPRRSKSSAGRGRKRS